MKVIEDIAAAAEQLAKRAQPHTAASRLSLRDFHDVITYLALSAHALGDGIEDRLAEALPARAWSPTRQAGARINFAAGYLDDATSAMVRDLRALRDRDPGNLDGEQTRGRRWLARAAERFITHCEELRQGAVPPPLPEAEQVASVEQLRGICGMFGSAVNHVAILTDAACERSLGCTSGALTPLVAARQEIEKARQRTDVLKAVFQG